ncbi:MAG: metalloregulator ArsR/SmtB family transcription factor [Actinobacteria bacterium]|nr:metalloregulator ArsR/SmtB family transcription factor [Actinomycetota bacterium]MCI0544849.1 metalloregulator ArsR/SmtB family transcription factor [Actinomycetota bacterium]MCI0678466.1 metalloregulator ArsR/SmtB family transcription factor [Actinomycetota bacterium]
MDALQVVAEPRRREILRLIWDEEMAAGEIAGHFDLTFGAVSQHLSVLREASLVEMRREGNRHIYKANLDALAPYRTVLEMMWGGALEDLKTAVESKGD